MVVLLNKKYELNKNMKSYKCEKQIVLNFVKCGVKKINNYEKYNTMGFIYSNLELIVNCNYSRYALPSTNALLILIMIEDYINVCENNRLRDNLLVARDEINLLRLSKCRERSHSHSPHRRRGSGSD